MSMDRPTAQTFAQFPANRQGRDFIVGDLHGCLPLLEDCLAAVAFDPERDRLFSVGDLVDRGPDSLGVLRLIEKPWFYYVLGNHDADLFETLDNWSDRRARVAPYSDLIWIDSLSDEDYAKLVHLSKKLRNAPLVIQVGEGAERFYLCHADRSKVYVHESDVTLLSDDELRGALDVNQRSSLLWSRDLRREIANKKQAGAAVKSHPFYDAIEPAIEPGVSITFVGHSQMAKPTLYRSHLFIDMGAYDEREGWLTLFNVIDFLRVEKTNDRDRS